MTAVDAVQSRIQQIITNLATLKGGGDASGTDGVSFDAALTQVQAASGASGAGTTTGATGTGLVAGGAGATLPSGVTGQDIVGDAQKYLGIPYVFGGQSGSGMDCSGLVRQVMGDLGLDVGHSVVPQAELGTPVASLADAQPGDLIVTKGDEHIAIYAGNGQIIEAPREGEDVVQRANWIDPSQIETIRRVTSPATASTTGGLDATTLSQLAAATGLGGAALQQLLAQVSGGGAAQGSSSTSGAAAGTSAASVAAAMETSSAQAALAGLASISGAASGDAGGSQTGGDADGVPDLSSLLAASGLTTATQTASFSAQLGQASAASNTASAAPSLPQQLTQPIVNLVREPGTGDQTVVVKVSPEQFGPITVSAHSDASGLHIHLTAPSGAGHDALAATLTDLRRDLASNGISGSVSLGLSSDGGATAQQQNGQQAQLAALELLTQNQAQTLASSLGGQAFAGQGGGQGGYSGSDPLQQVTAGADAPMVSVADATEGAISRIGSTGLDVLA